MTDANDRVLSAIEAAYDSGAGKFTSTSDMLGQLAAAAAEANIGVSHAQPDPTRCRGMPGPLGSVRLPAGDPSLGRLKPCCDSHNERCEPPGDLCCHRCTEAAHDTFPIRHADGSRCVLEYT